jgi:hypothetical protein
MRVGRERDLKVLLLNDRAGGQDAGQRGECRHHAAMILAITKS